jgi:hypothetical protein
MVWPCCESRHCKRVDRLMLHKSLTFLQQGDFLDAALHLVLQDLGLGLQLSKDFRHCANDANTEQEQSKYQSGIRSNSSGTEGNSYFIPSHTSVELRVSGMYKPTSKPNPRSVSFCPWAYVSTRTTMMYRTTTVAHDQQTPDTIRGTWWVEHLSEGRFTKIRHFNYTAYGRVNPVTRNVNVNANYRS